MLMLTATFEKYLFTIRGEPLHIGRILSILNEFSHLNVFKLPMNNISNI